jgi:uncharacterized membrane protein YfcA
MDLWSGLGIAGAGLAAGAINAVVGSGTLVTFPTLLAFGFTPFVANVSNTIGLVPGSVSGVYAYRQELAGREQKSRLLRLGGFSGVGAVLGSVLLLAFPGSTFRRVVPWLILFASALMLLQPWVSGRLRPVTCAGESHRVEHWRLDSRGLALVAIVFATGVYAGYFGAAQGVVLISVLAIFVADHLQRLNALKNVLTLLANFVAGAIFTFSGHVAWPAAGAIAAGAVVGGQIGGRLGRRLPQQVLRLVIVTVGTAVAISLLV